MSVMIWSVQTQQLPLVAEKQQEGCLPLAPLHHNDNTTRHSEQTRTSGGVQAGSHFFSGPQSDAINQSTNQPTDRRINQSISFHSQHSKRQSNHPPTPPPCLAPCHGNPCQKTDTCCVIYFTHLPEGVDDLPVGEPDASGVSGLIIQVEPEHLSVDQVNLSFRVVIIKIIHTLPSII